MLENVLPTPVCVWGVANTVNTMNTVNIVDTENTANAREGFANTCECMVANKVNTVNTRESGKKHLVNTCHATKGQRRNMQLTHRDTKKCSWWQL